MKKIHLLEKIKDVYEKNENIIEYLHSLEEGDGGKSNSSEEILISYDFQSGSYYDEYKKNPEVFLKYHDQLAEILDVYIKRVNGGCTILEAGVGEARSLVPILNRIGFEKIKKAYGFDISWSRVKFGERFERDFGQEKKNKICFFVSDLLNIAVGDAAVDIVFTAGAVEPNGGKEKEVLRELYRITKRYLVLFEPLYEFASQEIKERMVKYGYITHLYETAVEMGYNVIKHESLKISLNPLNPMGVIVIEKLESEESNQESEGNIFCEPVTKKNLEIGDYECFCEASMLVYPVVRGIPCLLKDNAIVATKYKEFIGC